MHNVGAIQRRFLLVIFVVSGFTGLIYESIWSHYLKLFLGHAAYAQTAVLAIFMGGMALGSWLVARYCSRLRNLLWGYLLVEGLTGLLGLLFHRVFVALTELSFTTVIPALPAGLPINAYKWALATVLLLPQSVLLGMTFPLISGGIIRRWPERAGETLATLYFTNSLGAAIGVLVSGFVLIGLVGLPGTTLTAGLLNMVLALAVWLAVRRAPEPPPQASLPAAAAAPPDRAARWFVLAAFLTGAAAFMYELGWIRMLSLVLGSTTHSFELMLSAFIFGLAFGGLYVRKRIERISDPETHLGAIMVVMGALAALTLPAGNVMFEFMAWAMRAFTHTGDGYLAFNVLSQTIAVLIMVPATFCAGMTLPLLTHALLRRGAGEQAIGTIYAVNTLGAIVGVLLAIHLLIPLLGIKGVILTGALIHVALGVSRVRPRELPRPLTVIGIAASVAVVAVVLVAGGLDPRRVVSSVYRTGIPVVPGSVAVPYLRDGKTATVSLSETDGMMWIATNGKPDAAIQVGPGAATSDEGTMVLAAAIPLSLHVGARRIANIGFGSGLTTHLLLASPALERLDSIEIEPLMVEAARQGFGSRIHNVFEDPRSHIIYEDAKTFFAASREPYDLIVSEPSNPWVSGVASLFSDEFYARIVGYLRPDGLFVQWIQSYETDLSVVASVAKALSRHFGTYVLYNMDDTGVLIVAGRATQLPPMDGRILQWPLMRTELDRVGVQSVRDLQQRLIGDGHTLGPLLWSFPVPANSDFFPYVDLNAPRLRFLSSNAIALPRLTSTSIPVLELMRAEAPAGPTAEPLRQSRLYRDGRVRRALAVRRALLSGSPAGLEEATAAAVLLLDVSAQRCAGQETQAAWMRAVQLLTDQTAAYLSTAEVADIGNRITASACYRELAAPRRAWVDLLGAVSRRDADQIERLGTQLLQSTPPLSGDDLTYLATALAAARVGRSQLPLARQLLESEWSRVSHEGEYALALGELLMLARAGTSNVAGQADALTLDQRARISAADASTRSRDPLTVR